MNIKVILEAVKNWHSYSQLQFLNIIPNLITIAFRDILEEKETSNNDKLQAIKWGNEFQHRILNAINSIKKGELKDTITVVFKDAQFYGKQNKITKNSIGWAITKAYERTKEDLNNPSITPKEQYIIMNALNEICSGAYAVDQEEFHTLIGANKEDVLQLWSNLNNKWVDKYEIRKDKDETCISHSLMKFGQPIDENEEVIFSFEAENYIRASEVLNRFLGFEPYVPMPENVAVHRIYSLNDKDNKAIKEVTLTIYQPIKNNENEWACSYQISEIQNNALYSILGVDALQSFQLALNIIDGLLKTYNKDTENQIVWLDKYAELIK